MLLLLVLSNPFGHLFIRQQIINRDIFRGTMRAFQIVIKEGVGDTLHAICFFAARGICWFYEQAFVNWALQPFFLQCFVTARNFFLSRR